ncbi:MAG: hypothetical protein N2246_07240, partial [Candidatus Sumerlaeia bacterium]|nr:hypothetical protein [Candidatus Sumerlaeia bacterium]
LIQNQKSRFYHKLSMVMLITALSLLSVVFQGHQFGIGNNTIDISWILHRQSRGNFLPNDWYLSTATYHPNVVVMLSWLASFVPMDVAFLLAHILTRIILCFGTYYLAYYMFESRIIALLSIVLVILFPRLSAGGHYLQAAHFEANFLGFSLATLLLAFLVRAQSKPKSYYLAAVVSGLLINAHLFIGLHLLAIFILQLVLDRQNRRHLFRAIPLAISIGPPPLLPVVKEFFNQPPLISSRDVAELLAFRHPHHHSPFSWQAGLVAMFFYYTWLWIFLHFRVPSPAKRTEQIVLVYVLATAILHIVFVELIPVGIVAYLQSFRQTVLFTLFVSIYVAMWSVMLIQRKATFNIIIGVALILSFRMPYIFIPLSILAIISGVKAEELQKMPEFTFSPKLLITLLLMMLSLLLIWSGAKGWLNPLFNKILSDREHFRRHYLSNDMELNDVCLWINNNTSPQATFIIPPTIEGFRIISERACVVDYKSVTFKPLELWEWFNRISRIGQLLSAIKHTELQPYDSQYAVLALKNLHQIRFAGRTKDLLEQGFRKLTSDTVEKLAQLYNANYLLTYVDCGSYNFKKIYVNNRYALYLIR